jgi:uncharacterized repeat protein (TIGR03833 family)
MKPLIVIMRLLKIFKDQEPNNPNKVDIRQAARGIFFDESNLIPILFVRQDNYHKLPGGGVEENEDLLQALAREVQEETGCAIKVLNELGQIKEYRSQYNLEQTSYGYLGIVTSKGATQYTEDELAKGFELVWMTLDQAIEAVEHDEPESYEGIFIQKRDLTFLRTAQAVIVRRAAYGGSGSHNLAMTHKTVTRYSLPITNTPWTKGSSEGQRRGDVRPGAKVAIVLKKDQPTGKLTEGVVQDILTSSANHPRGIKVRLTTGQVGRVQIIR